MFACPHDGGNYVSRMERIIKTSERYTAYRVRERGTEREGARERERERGRERERE